jgi:hypothetical protein
VTRLRFGTVSRRTATVRNTPCVRLPRYPNQRFGVPALLAPERNVSKERYCGAGQRYCRMGRSLSDACSPEPAVEYGERPKRLPAPGFVAPWSKQPAIGWAKFAFRMEEWGRLQNQEDGSWDKLASRLGATPWYRWKSRCRLLRNQLHHRRPTKPPTARLPLPRRNRNQRISAEADHDHEPK